MDYSRYPADWRNISQRIRFRRAGGRCECAGECGREHGDGTHYARCTAHNGDPTPTFHVILTVAHLDKRGAVCDCEPRTGRKCGNEHHLRAMCQACHLRYDAARHKFTARRTRALRAGQLWLGDMENSL